MRPYNSAGNSSKTPKKKAKGAKQKAKDVAGGVKKTVVKAKVNALKAGKRKLNKAEKEEVDELMEKTATNGDTSKVVVTPSASKGAVAKKGMQIKKLKSMVTLKSYQQMSNEESFSDSPRRSKRLATNGDHEPVNDVSHISIAEEAVEDVKPKPGFLSKTMSRIWKFPHEATSGVAYGEIENGAAAPKASNGAANDQAKTCIIS